MDEDAPADAGPAVVVEITPRSYRTQSIVFVVGGLVLTAVSLWFGSGDGRSSTSPFFGLAATAYGIYCGVQSRRQVTRTLLHIDGSGIRSEDGRYDQTWSGVLMVWVGSSTGLRLPLVGQPTISLFTGAGVDFARRAGTRPKPRLTVPVGLPWTVRRLSERLRAITDVPVVEGTRVSRAAAASALEGSDGP